MVLTADCQRLGRCEFVERLCTGGGDEPRSISSLLFTVKGCVSETSCVRVGAGGEGALSSILFLSVCVCRHRVRAWQTIRNRKGCSKGRAVRGHHRRDRAANPVAKWTKAFLIHPLSVERTVTTNNCIILGWGYPPSPSS